jgi:CRP-like cAMP-binding protein
VLASIPLFADLGPAALDALARHAVERHARRGEALFRAGDAAAGIYVVLDGAVRVVRDDGHRRVVLHVERGGSEVGEEGDRGEHAESLRAGATMRSGARWWNFGLTRGAWPGLIVSASELAGWRSHGAHDDWARRRSHGVVRC